jgi:GTP-binding protein
MIINACRFHMSAARPELFPRGGFPEIAFMGRSNVGKSSLLNALLGVKGLARTSKSPGRTQAIHFYRVNDRLYFVDLPGYGYAKVPKEMRAAWQHLVESYLQGPSRPDLAVQLVDARHEPTDLDGELLEWLGARGIRHQVVLTKADKLSRSERARALQRGARWLGGAAAGGPGGDAAERVLAVSAVTGDGLPQLWKIIDDALAAKELTLNKATFRAAGSLPAPTPRGNPYRGGRNTL